MLKKKKMPAIICFVIATFIKIIPVFFLIWLVFRGNFKTYIRIILMVSACIFIPFILRGFNTGWMDLKNYYLQFIKPFQEGRVEYPFSNQSLSAAVYRLFQPLTDTQNIGEDHAQDFQPFYLPIEIVKKIYTYIVATLFLSFIVFLSFTTLRSTFSFSFHFFVHFFEYLQIEVMKVNITQWGVASISNSLRWRPSKTQT